MTDRQLVEACAKEAGVVGAFDPEGRFAVASGWNGRPWFAPLDDDCDCFQLATRFHGLKLDLIVARAHETFNQLDLIRQYVRRNVALAVAEIHLMPREQKYAYGW